MSYIAFQKTPGGKVNIALVTKVKNEKNGKWIAKREHLGLLDVANNELLLSRSHDEPTSEIMNLLHGRNIRYTGQRSPLCGRNATPGSKYSQKIYSCVSDIIEIGEVHTLRLLCDETGLTAALTNESSFGGINGMALLYLAIWQVCTGESQYMAGEWLSRRELPVELSSFDFSSGALSKFMEKIFLDGMGRQEFRKLWIISCGYPKTVVYDTTVFFTYSGRPVMAEYGYAHGHGDGLPQYNFTMALDAVAGLPLAYRLLPGSVTDMVTLDKTTECLCESGLTDFLIITDKGFYSETNAACCLERKIRFLSGVPFISKQSLILRATLREQCNDIKNQMMFNRQRLGVVETSWQVKTSDGIEHSLYGWLTKNFSRAQCQNDSLLESLENFDCQVVDVFFRDEKDYSEWLKGHDKRTAGLYVQQQAEKWCVDAAKKRKGRPGIAKSVKKFMAKEKHRAFDTREEGKTWLEEQGGKLSARCTMVLYHGFFIVRNESAINEIMANNGISFHVSSEAMEKLNLIARIRGRDDIEKVFDLMKNDNAQGRIRSGCSEIIEGRMFLAFLAAIVRKIFNRKFQAAKPNYCKSVDAALRQLQNIRAIRYSSGHKSMVEIPKKTRDLMAAMNIVIPAVE